MPATRFLDEPLSLERARHIQGKTEVLKTRIGVQVSDAFTALAVAHIALNEHEPQTSPQLEARTGIKQSSLSYILIGLEEVGFIERGLVPPPSQRVGRTTKAMRAKDELYEAVTIKPLWQDTIRLCVLAAHLGVSPAEASTQAIADHCLRLGIASPADVSTNPSFSRG